MNCPRINLCILILKISKAFNIGRGFQTEIRFWPSLRVGRPWLPRSIVGPTVVGPSSSLVRSKILLKRPVCTAMWQHSLLLKLAFNPQHITNKTAMGGEMSFLLFLFHNFINAPHDGTPREHFDPPWRQSGGGGHLGGVTQSTLPEIHAVHGETWTSEGRRAPERPSYRGSRTGAAAWKSSVKQKTDVSSP